MPDTNQRQDLADFLRNQRDRLLPETVGLKSFNRRRAPGLRREEVAMLAGISTEWYTWLEQARDINVSQEVLERIAIALRLEPSETEYILLLAGCQSSTITAKNSSISPQLQRVLDRLEYTPAYIMGRRWDILGWNKASVVVFGDFSQFTGMERNSLWQSFLGSMKETMVDWSRHAKAELDTFRASQARYAHYSCKWVEQFIETLKLKSPEFKSWWQEHDVQDWDSGVKHFNLPLHGQLSFEHNAFQIADRSFNDLKLVTYVPLPNTDTLAKIKAIY